MSDPLVRLAAVAPGAPASAMMACPASKSPASAKGSWAMVWDQTQLPTSFRRVFALDTADVHHFPDLAIRLGR